MTWSITASLRASATLVAALVAMTDRPWGECNHGKAITQNQLARRLKPFGVSPKNVGPKHDRAKGYTLESFADAFKRYIPPDSSVHPLNINEINDLYEDQTVHQENGCTDETSSNTLNLNELCECTDENPLPKQYDGDGAQNPDARCHEGARDDAEDAAPARNNFAGRQAWRGRVWARQTP